MNGQQFLLASATLIGKSIDIQITDIVKNYTLPIKNELTTISVGIQNLDRQKHQPMLL